MALNDDIDSEDAADVKLGANPDAIARRLNRVLHKLTVASTRLTALVGAIPPGPPGAPALAALNSIVAQTAQITATANGAIGGGPVIGPQ